MISVATVCNVYDDPAVPIRMFPGQCILSVRVKSIDTGRLMSGLLPTPTVCDERFYLALPGFDYGERVAVRLDLISMDDVEAWLANDEEVPYYTWLLRPSKPTETLSEPAQDTTPSEGASEPVQEPEPPQEDAKGIGSLQGGVTGCTVSELRTVLIEVMRRQDRAMTVREIATILNSDTVDARSRIAANLADMEDKGLVKRGGYVPSSSPGRKTATTWVVA